MKKLSLINYFMCIGIIVQIMELASNKLSNKETSKNIKSQND